VEKKNFISRRPELSIAEVLEQYDCTIDDLFHEALLENLTIYYLVPANSKVKWIRSVTRGFHRLLSEDSDPHRKEYLAKNKHLDDYRTMFPELKDVNEDEWEDIILKRSNDEIGENLEENQFFTSDEFRESISPFSWYLDKELYQSVYSTDISGLMPVFWLTLRSYRKGDTDYPIDVAAYEGSLLPDLPDEDFYFTLDSEISISEAIKANKLFVMKEDLQALSGQPTNPDDIKPEGAVSRKSLLKLVIGMAVNGYTYDPSSKKNNAGTEIKEDLEKMGLGLDPQTIRDALKEASTLIPSKPA